MRQPNIFIGRGVKSIISKSSKSATVTTGAPKTVQPARADYRYATPAQSAAYRQSLIDKGLIKSPRAAQAA